VAKIQEEQITIKLSKLVKSSDTPQSDMISSDIISALEQVVQELVGDNIIVEISI